MSFLAVEFWSRLQLHRFPCDPPADAFVSPATAAAGSVTSCRKYLAETIGVHCSSPFLSPLLSCTSEGGLALRSTKDGAQTCGYKTINLG